MPLYEYYSDACGVFSALQKMSQYRQPMICTGCGCMSERLISVPNFALLGKNQRVAHERNEQSAHAPRSMSRSCGCAGVHSCKAPPDKTKTVKASDQQTPALQMQTKRTARPWMLSH